VPAVFPINELARDPHARASFPHASFQDKSYPELLSYLLDLYRFALVSERRVAGDHEEARHIRQVGNNILRNTITEVFLFRVAAHVVERQDRNRRFF
jgi:hypothetical protein